MQPFKEIERPKLQWAEALATDIDGTLTDADNHFSPELIAMLRSLQRHKIQVILITGRPASWIQAFVEYLPVSGGIGENGGIWCPKQSEAPMISLETLAPISTKELAYRRDGLRKVFEQIVTKFPKITPTADCVTRLTDWTFPIRGLNERDLMTIEEICERNHYGFTHSSIHGHIKPAKQNKAWGIERLIQMRTLAFSRRSIFTVGDSKNDQEMFDPQKFPNSIGVANIRRHEKVMTILPTFITEKEGVDGFLEIGEALLTIPVQTKK